MSEIIQFVQYTPEQLQQAIINGIKTHLDDLKKHLQPKEPTEYMTRKEVAKMLSVDVSTIHNLCEKSVLQKYQIGGRILFKRVEVENAIIKLEK
jgi:excisionase family DNA binding protein